MLRSSRRNSCWKKFAGQQSPEGGQGLPVRPDKTPCWLECSAAQCSAVLIACHGKSIAGLSAVQCSVCSLLARALCAVGVCCCCCNLGPNWPHYFWALCSLLLGPLALFTTILGPLFTTRPTDHHYFWAHCSLPLGPLLTTRPAAQ